MLCLTRKVGEKVYIGDVTITVLDAGGGRARLGIDAPRDVPILRQEPPAIPPTAVEEGGAE